MIDDLRNAPLLSTSEPIPILEEERPARILLADDNADMRQYVQRLLSEKYEVIAVADGEAALKSARAQRPDLILSDVMMPRLDGFGVLQAVRAEKSLRNVPVILLSARAGEESRIEGLQSGADDYLVKPFSARELLARVSSHLAIARVRGDAAELERKLRLDAEMLAAIVATSDDAIISKNLDGIITTWNSGAERIFGYTVEEAIGRPITLLIPADRQNEEAEILGRIRRGERVDHFQTVRIRKDGTMLDISVTVSPLRDSSGTVIGASKVARDISKQKRAEVELRESEERFRAIVETTPECVKVVAPDGTLLHMNTPGLRTVGAARAEQVIGKNLYDLIAPEDRDKFRAFNESVCRGKRGSIEFDIMGLEGKRRHMETHAAPLRSPDGSVAQLAVTRDVSERKQAEEALRESEERLRALVNASSYVVYRMSPDWSTMRQLDGQGSISKGESSTKDWLQEYVHPEDQPSVLQAILNAIRSKSPFEREHRVQHPDGTIGWTLSRAVPRLDAQGEIIEWFGAASDLTRRKQAEENYRKLAETLDIEVRARTKEVEERNADILQQSDQLRELSWRLLRTQDEERRHIARELHDSAGQTLSVLGINLSQLVQKTGRRAPELAMDAERIQETVQQLHREIRTASYLLHPPLLDESGLSSALNWYTQGLGERSGLEITLDIPAHFQRLPGDMELLVFRLVQECLTNVHRHSGSKTALIRVGRQADLLTVTVQDRGKGMSPARLAEIQSQSAGVGIRGMRERLRQFHGDMTVESDRSGTRIFMKIPIPKSGVAPEPASSQPARIAV